VLDLLARAARLADSGAAVSAGAARTAAVAIQMAGIKLCEQVALMMTAAAAPALAGGAGGWCGKAAAVVLVVVLLKISVRL